jgi:hypothetical protein
VHAYLDPALVDRRSPKTARPTVDR